MSEISLLAFTPRRFGTNVGVCAAFNDCEHRLSKLLHDASSQTRGIPARLIFDRIVEQRGYFF